jgi:hypothetical protein
VDDEFRLEVDLDDEAHGNSLEQRLRARDLDDEAKRRLGRSVIVSRDGSRLFVYAESETAIREAESVVRELLSEDDLSGAVAVTRWHPIEQEWRDASIPLPRTPEEEAAEYERREAAEEREAQEEGEFDWHVVAHADGRDDAEALAGRLAAEGVPVARRWRWVVAGALTEERAEELAARMRREAPEGTEVRVEVNPSDLPRRPMLFLA